MKKVIDFLEKELERQNILHTVNKIEKDKKNILPGYKGPPLFPENHLFINEIEQALAILKTK